jgi:hypothetical protein
MRSRVAGLVLVVVLGGVAAGGCDGSGDDGASRDAQMYVATIRVVLAEEPPPQPDVLPVVYVVGVGETKIPADVQADVAVDLDDDADIRFADKRAEAIIEDEAHAPVRDDGVLLAVGDLPADARPMLLEVEVYRSDQDSSKVVFTIGRRSSQWTVTSSSVLSETGS